ncbi:MAG: hypothetical protein H0X66_11295 [Verrucomicrobia bacterium]|nr:hypothetical protein [Verrucomicrobiota bacterium]
MKTPAERILAINRSLRCFAMGWCSLLPPLGIFIFPFALVTFQRARIDTSGEWNPASRYLNWGMILAAIGGCISAVVTALIVWRVCLTL